MEGGTGNVPCQSKELACVSVASAATKHCVHPRTSSGPQLSSVSVPLRQGAIQNVTRAARARGGLFRPPWTCWARPGAPRRRQSGCACLVLGGKPVGVQICSRLTVSAASSAGTNAPMGDDPRRTAGSAKPREDGMQCREMCEMLGSGVRARGFAKRSRTRPKIFRNISRPGACCPFIRFHAPAACLT